MNRSVKEREKLVLRPPITEGTACAGLADAAAVCVGDKEVAVAAAEPQPGHGDRYAFAPNHGVFPQIAPPRVFIERDRPLLCRTDDNA